MIDQARRVRLARIAAIDRAIALCNELQEETYDGAGKAALHELAQRLREERVTEWKSA